MGNFGVIKTFIIINCVCLSLFSQKRPFPQGVVFPNCIKPNVAQVNMDYYISEFYKSWKTAYLKPSGSTTGGYYIYTHGTSGVNTVTVSEAHGYGMITFALMAGTGSYADPKAKEYFDGMYAFFKAHPSKDCNYLMTWAVNTNGSNGETFTKDYTATDGDLDIAYALVLAHYQWGSDGTIDYLGEAKKVIAAIKQYEMNPVNKRVMICGSSNWANSSESQYWVSRCSDWMADHFHTYFEITGDTYWNDAISTIYSTHSTLSANYSAQTGLVPDFINGQNPVPFNYSGKLYYSFDACRFPWRIATDFAHNGSSQAKTVLNKISGWLMTQTSSDPNNIMAEYQLNGTPVGDYNSTAFTSPFLTACMADKSSASLDYLTKGYNLVKSEKEDYYEDSINLLCMLLFSGNWWKPDNTIAITNQGVSKKNFFKCDGIFATSSSTLVLNYTVCKPGATVFQIFDLRGSLIHAQTLENDRLGKNTAIISLNGMSLHSGIYTMGLVNNGQSIQKKVQIVF